jgi:hypothetical protein
MDSLKTTVVSGISASPEAINRDGHIIVR